MNCPNCSSLNEPDSRFCISCGHDMTGQPVGHNIAVISRTSIHRQYIGVSTSRLLIALLLLWFLRSILINLSFVEGLVIPDIPFAAEQIVTFLAYLVAFVLLTGYTQSLRTQWAQAYPRLASLTPALTVIIYVIVLSLLYRALQPIIYSLSDDPGEFMLVFRVVLTFLALLLLGWAGRVVYAALPGWLSSISFDTPAGPKAGVACLHCGRLNQTATSFCGYCGKSLAPKAETE